MALTGDIMQGQVSKYMGFQGVRTHQPCAACRMLRRRCNDDCLLAPYFPLEEFDKFAIVHKVFGASNVTKMIQMVEEAKREDTVKAIVYEATARLRDPVYGSAGTISQLQKMVQELKLQLETTKGRVLVMQRERDDLLHILVNDNQLGLVSGINDDAMLYGGYSWFDDQTVAYDPASFPLECDWIM